MSLAQLFFARERLRRRARELAGARRARRRSPLVFEPLEGRLLLSADVLLLNNALLDPTLPALVEPLEPTPTLSLTAASPVNVDEFVGVTLSGLVLDRATDTFDSRATITNVSAGETLQEPMRLVVTSIASTGGVTLANAGGQTEEGDGFVRLVAVQVHRALAEDERATELLVSARNRLLWRAGRIADPELRKSFMRGVPEPALTLELAEQLASHGRTR